MRVTSPITILAGEDLEAHRRVMFNGTAWVYADANDPHQAVVGDARIPSGRYGAAYPANAPGIIDIEAASTLAAGGNAYGADDGKVTSTTTGLFIGMVITAPLAAANPAGVMPLPAASGETLLFSLTTPQTSDGSGTSEVFFTGYSLPANTVKAGDVYKIKMGVTVANSNGTDTLAVKLYFGPDLINTLAAVDSVNGDVAVVDAEITIRTIGASGTAHAVLHTQVDVDAEGDPVIARTVAEFAIDTTAAINIRASSTWTGGHADDDARLDTFNVSRLRKGV